MATPETIVTVDGPAGSGKTTVARRAAEVLGYLFLDTGAMYRAATLAALEAGVRLDPMDEDSLIAALEAARLDIDEDGTVRLGGSPVDDRIRDGRVTSFVSLVSAVPRVRERLTALQRAFGVRAEPGLVAEGRDMATVVFPFARHRFFLDATVARRARRRAEDLRSRGLEVPPLVDLEREIARRDEYDSTREVAPLRVADGVEVIDTTDLDVEEVVRRIVESVLEARTSGGGV